MTNKEKHLLDGNSIGKILSNLFLLTAGCAVYVVGVEGILMPQNFLNGGMVGIGLILIYLFPGLNFSWLYFFLNLPLLVLGWLTLSLKFILYTLFGVAIFSVLAWLINTPELTVVDPILAAILGGVICGAGAGVILRSSGSAGGLDILGIYLKNKLSIPLGWTSFTVNCLVLTAGAIFFNLEMALYTMVFVFTQAKVTDAVLTGFNRRKAVLVISDQSEAIAREIMNRLHRGVTFLEGMGAYTSKEKKVIFSVITMTEMARLKNIVLGIDPTAFIVINDTLDVLGSSMGRPKEY